MIICKKCGAEIPDDNKFCGKCGTAVKSVADDVMSGKAQNPYGNSGTSAGETTNPYGNNNPYGSPATGGGAPNPYGKPYGNPYGKPYGNPYGNPYGTPNAGSNTNPYGNPQGNGTQDTPNQGTPYGNPYQSPYGTPYGNPYAVPPEDAGSGRLHVGMLILTVLTLFFISWIVAIWPFYHLIQAKNQPSRYAEEDHLRKAKKALIIIWSIFGATIVLLVFSLIILSLV